LAVEVIKNEAEQRAICWGENKAKIKAPNWIWVTIVTKGWDKVKMQFYKKYVCGLTFLTK